MSDYYRNSERDLQQRRYQAVKACEDKAIEEAEKNTAWISPKRAIARSGSIENALKEAYIQGAKYAAGVMANTMRAKLPCEHFRH